MAIPDFLFESELHKIIEVAYFEMKLKELSQAVAWPVRKLVLFRDIFPELSTILGLSVLQCQFVNFESFSNRVCNLSLLENKPLNSTFFLVAETKIVVLIENLILFYRVYKPSSRVYGPSKIKLLA